MSQVKLALDQLTLGQQIELARQIGVAMNGNASFPTPNPTLGDLLDFATDAETAMNAQRAAALAAQNATIAARTAQLALMNALTTEGNYVQNASGGDETKILSAGMRVRSGAAPIGPLPAPENLSATSGDMPGEVDLHWNRVRGASSYVLQYTTDPIGPNSVWTTCPPSTKSKCTVPNLAAGTRYWFRVAAAGAAGQGPWSDPATKMAQ